MVPCHNLSLVQKEILVQLLRNNKESLVWSYRDIKSIHPTLCTRNIYLKDGFGIVYQPRRGMNLALKNVVKEELQKLLNANFIFLISDGQWVSPLVIVPNKNGKWRVYVDYRELNKATQKDHFPLPFIVQLLDSLSGKKILSFSGWI